MQQSSKYKTMRRESKKRESNKGTILNCLESIIPTAVTEALYKTLYSKRTSVLYSEVLGR
jgi:hypothetical protein